MKLVKPINQYYITKNGKFLIGKRYYLYKESCEECKTSFLATSEEEKFCSYECCFKNRKGKIFTNEHKKKLSIAHKGKIINENQRNALLNSKGNWKGGVEKLNIPLYDTFKPKLEKYEEIRETEEGYLEVRCTYCGKWFMPKTSDVWNRLEGIKSNDTAKLYCSTGCKKQCPIYHQKPETLIKRDIIRAGLILPEELNREVQPELRKMVFERDTHICQLCGCTHSLHCHHFEGVWLNQLMSADVDMCITLCKKCHLKAHQQPGCTYYNLRRKIC